MKTPLLLLALSASVFAGQPVLARITPDALAKIQKDSPMANLEVPNGGTAQGLRRSEQSLIKQSLILHDGKNWTLVPRGAVIFVPDRMKARVDAKPVGRLLPWADFLFTNLSWITTQEITFDQAAGNETIPMKRAGFWTNQDKIVVAVHQHGPISVNLGAGTQTVTQR